MKKEQLIVVENAIEYMNNHLDEEVTSEELATHAGYSTYHFVRIFKEVTGVTPRHYLSALRIEASKEMLIKPSHSILKALLSIGYRSIGTYSSRFKQFVGHSPKTFRADYEKLFHYINFYHDKKIPFEKNTFSSTSTITCHIKAPLHFKGLVFIGLFSRPIPDQKPIVGTVLLNEGTCKFMDVPVGNYYLLAAALHWSINPKDYFILKNSLRGKYDLPIKITKDTNIEIEIQLRDPLPYDPPILINLPMLLFERDKK